ncbi:TPM domain-containing protein (plasmid) [Lactococcus lactis]|uniref:TPM domain-containing protein n=1 Tax=Lactococcus lactis TaxID=1358 RepID=UPI0033144643
MKKYYKVAMILATFFVVSVLSLTPNESKANTSALDTTQNIAPASDNKQQNYIEQSAKSQVLSISEITTLNTALNQFSQSTDKKTGELLNAQFAVCVVDRLNGASIEDYSQNLFNTKQIGDKAHNKGILLVVAIEDHKYRVQLGDGWKGTALNQDNIQDYVFGDSLTEMLRSENYDGAISQMVQRTIGIAGQEVTLAQPLQSYAEAYQSIKAQEAKEKAEYQEQFTKMISELSKVMLIGLGVVLGGVLIYVIVQGAVTLSRLKRYKKTKEILNVDLSFNENLDFLPDSVESLALEFSNQFIKPTEENIKDFLKEKADILREEQARKLAQEKREKTAKNFMNNELKSYKNLPVSYYEIIKAFLKTDLEPTEEDMRLFIQNFVHNYELLQKQEKAEYYKLDQQALKLTTKTPKTVYGDNIFEQLVMFNLLTSSFRSPAWFSSPEYKAESHSSISSTYTSSSYDTNSSSSTSSSGWSDFGGGGGFSGGDGASGGW